MEGERRGTNSSGMSRNGGGFESSNTLSEYLNAGDLYDSLKGEGSKLYLALLTESNG